MGEVEVGTCVVGVEMGEVGVEKGEVEVGACAVGVEKGGVVVEEGGVGVVVLDRWEF
jgi:hypothetical protein